MTNRLTFFVPLLVACSAHAFAQGLFYVRPGAQGTNDGSTWLNAYLQIPAALQRGATCYLADGDYARHRFNSPESAAKTIAIKKATKADHGTDDGWQAEFGDGVAEFSEIAFDSDWW